MKHVEIIEKDNNHAVIADGREIGRYDDKKTAEKVRDGLIKAQSHQISQAQIRAAEEHQRSQWASREQERGHDIDR